MLQTLRRLFRPSEVQIQAQDAYIALTKQARNPIFYRELGVPDTLDGRFELIVLHLWLQLTRWEASTNDSKRALIEAFFQDMDQNLREFGIDMGIKKRMKAMANGYNGHLTAYDAALAKGDDAALADAFARNIYSTADTAASDAQLAALTRYAREAVQPALASDWPAVSFDAAGM